LLKLQTKVSTQPVIKTLTISSVLRNESPEVAPSEAVPA